MAPRLAINGREGAKVTDMSHFTELGSRKVSRRRFLVGSAAATAAAGLGLSLLQDEGWLRVRPVQADAPVTEKTVITACSPNCGRGFCPLEVTVRNGRMVRIAPVKHADHPEFDRICLKGLSRIQYVYSPDRLKYPLKRVGPRGGGQWKRISWEEALDTIAEVVKKNMQERGPQSIGLAVSSGSGNYLSPGLRMATALRCVYATGGIDQDIPWADITMLGGGSDPAFEDYAQTRNQIYWGFNICETSIADAHFMLDAKQNGARIIVIDPRYSVTAAKADEWIPIEPGTDAALALGMMNVILAKGLEDRGYLVAHSVAPLLVRSDTKRFLRQSDLAAGGSDKVFIAFDQMTGALVPVDQAEQPALEGSFEWNGVTVKPAFQLLKERVASYTPETVSKICGVPAETVERLAVVYATEKPSVIRPGYGVDRWSNGDLSAMAIYTLPILTGNIGRPGSGIGRYPGGYPLKVGPWELPPGADPNAVRYMNPLYAVRKGSPVHVWIVQGNYLYQQVPDFNHTLEVLNDPEQTDLVVAIDILMTSTAYYADIVLPAASLFEKYDMIGSAPHSYVELQNKAIEPLFESKPDLEIYYELAKRLGVPEYFDKPAEYYLRRALENGDKTVAGITFEELQRVGFKRGNVPEQPIVPHADGKYATPTGRAQFYLEELIDFDAQLPKYEPPAMKPDSQYPLILNNAHSRFRAHSTYADIPWLLEINPYPVVEINKQDADARDIRDGDMVEVFTKSGHAVCRAWISEASRPGTVRLSEGWWWRQFEAGNYQELSVRTVNARQERIYVGPHGTPLGGWVLGTTFAFYEQPCQVRKWRGEGVRG